MKTYQLFICIFVYIFLSFFLAATASATISCTGQNCTDNFNSGFGSWSDNSIPQQETAICGSACDSVKLSNTTQSSPDGRLFKSFAVTPGATYQVSIKAGVYTDGASPNGSVTLTAVSGTKSSVIYCFNTSCTALGNSINGSLSVTITPDNSTLWVYLDGNQGGCDITFGNCHDPFVDDFTLTQTAAAPIPPSAPTNLSASCPAPGTTGSLSWIDGTGATSHNLRIDNKANGWSANCSSLNPGDLCYDNASPGNFPSQAGATYGWWVDACNSAGCTTGSGTNFTCRGLTISASCSVSPISTSTGTNVTWTADVQDGTSPFTYAWSGDAPLQGKTGNPATFSYSTTGIKRGSVTVRDSTGTTTPSTACSNSVTITAPDLQVEPLSPVTVEVNNPVSISATVKNHGDGTTGVSSTTRLKIDTNKDNIYDSLGVNGDKTTGILSTTSTASHSWSSVWTPTQAGTYNYQVCADAANTVNEGTTNEGNNCKVSSITVNAPPAAGAPTTPTVTYPACSTAAYTATISWSGTPLPPTDTTGCPNGFWVDIDNDSNWINGYFHKCTTSTSTTAPVGFGAYAGASGSLTLQPDLTYYARVYNGVQSGVRSFSSPACSAAFNYSLSNNGGITLTQGSSGSNTITRNYISGTSAGVTISASGLPAGASVQSITSNPCSPNCSSTLTISTSSTTPTGSPTITVTGSPLGKTTSFILTVNAAGGPTCDGDNICEAGETTLNCPTDCPGIPGGTCGNDICEAGETTASCPADCPSGGPSCGDDLCGGNEPISCRSDCPTVPAPGGILPWIQTVGGDVHSNTRIYTPGGP